MKKKKILLIIFFLAAFLILTNNCSKKKTELDLIKETLERIAENVENKNPDNIMIYIAETYSDKSERNKEDIKKIITSYINRYKGIVANILEVKSIYIKPLKALIETEIVLSSGIARALRKVTNIAGRYYKFTIELVRESSIWIVKSTEWKYISEYDLSLESKNILQHLE